MERTTWVARPMSDVWVVHEMMSTSEAAAATRVAVQQQLSEVLPLRRVWQGEIGFVFRKVD